MTFINIEIKAKCFHPQTVEAFLVSRKAVFKGTDHQTDTYFHVPKGRLKLRKGNIENNLIYYERNDQKGPKQSDFRLLPVHDHDAMLAILTASLGIKVVVEKFRSIYFLDNIKVHLDEVPGLGSFVEIEASNLHQTDLPVKTLRSQCASLMQSFGITEKDLLTNSYSDMILELGSHQH
jgi:predicted adenylyl cyclase CyaB